MSFTHAEARGAGTDTGPILYAEAGVARTDTGPVLYAKAGGAHRHRAHTRLMLGWNSKRLLQQTSSGVGSSCLVILHVGLGSEACHDVLHAEAAPTPTRTPTPQHGVAGAHYLGVAAALPQLSELPHQAPSNAAIESYTGVSLVRGVRGGWGGERGGGGW